LNLNELLESNWRKEKCVETIDLFVAAVEGEEIQEVKDRKEDFYQIF
jgi:hypothetical protein